MQLSNNYLEPTINVETINSVVISPVTTLLSFASISIKKFTLNVESVNIVFG